MKELVIFGGGFITHNVCNLLQSKYHINVLARNNAHQTFIQDTNFIQVNDLCNADELKSKLSPYLLENANFLLCANKGGNRLKKDSFDELKNNINIFWNISNIIKHGKIFIIGSGAENRPNCPYGLSKKIITNLAKDNSNIINLRLFGTFGKKEAPGRFISECFKCAFDHDKFQVYKNIPFAFLSMFDFAKILEYCIENDVPNEIDCHYKDPIYLGDLAKYIYDLCRAPRYLINCPPSEDIKGYQTNVELLYSLGIPIFGLKESLKMFYTYAYEIDVNKIKIFDACKVEFGNCCGTLCERYPICRNSKRLKIQCIACSKGSCLEYDCEHYYECGYKITKDKI